MKTGLYQGTTLKQEMKINPRLYQAMDLLYMPLLDLQAHLKQELLNNPFLEMGEESETEDAPEVEKPEEKEKRDKEHEERFKRLEAQLAREKTLDGWVFVVERKTLAPLLRERSRFIEEPEPAQAKK